MTAAVVSPAQLRPERNFAFILVMSTVARSPMMRIMGGRETPASARFWALRGAITPTLPAESVEDDAGSSGEGSEDRVDGWPREDSRSLRSLSCWSDCLSIIACCCCSRSIMAEESAGTVTLG